MNKLLFDARFYETYYFANVVRNVLHDQISYIRKLDEFYGDNKHLGFVRSFPRYSAFHSFIEFSIDYIIWEESDEIDLERRQAIQRNYSSIPSALDDLKPTLLPIDLAFNYYQIEHTSFEGWLSRQNKTFQDATSDDVSDYYYDLRIEGPYEMLMDRAVNEVFSFYFRIVVCS